MTTIDPNAPSPRHAPMGFVEFLTFCSAGMAINSLAVSIMLAALPEIASAYAMADANRQQLVLTVFFTGFSIGQIGVGLFSDRFGRRATFLFGMVVYCVATVACVFAPTFEILLIARFLAGMASAVPRVVVVSAVRDCYVGRRMASLMSLVMTVLFVAPILAPTLGHLILLGSNWQVLFGILLIHGVVMLGWSWARQPETQKAEDVRPIRFAPFMAAVKAFFLNRQSVLVTLASGACQGCLLAFLVSSPQVIGEHYGLGKNFTLAFSAIGVTMAMAAFSNSWLVTRLGMRRIALGALIICLAVSLISFGAAMRGALPFAAFMATFFVLNSLLMMNSANFTALAMEPHGAIAGMASSLFGASTTFISAAIASAIGQAYDGTAVPLVAGSLACCAVALVLVAMVARSARALRNS